MRRIGPQMQRAVAFIEQHPGCNKGEVARVLASNPYSSMGLSYGYQIVNRCVKAGLVRFERGARGAYRLFSLGADVS